ncbi:outer membrane lipoprotein SlyB [Paraburkholderia caballeronis]|nr:outer membrane lipoprotein SlyB [Paraburkholderia caballeronis]
MKRIGTMASVCVGVSALLSGCAYNSSSPDVFRSAQAQRESTVRMATVESVRPVQISANDGQPSGLGAVGGGALGALAGASIGGGRGSIATGILGGMAGAVAGNAVENTMAMRQGVEITVLLDSGELRAITQASSGDIFRPGQRVRLVSSGGITRVTH